MRRWIVFFTALVLGMFLSQVAESQSTRSYRSCSLRSAAVRTPSDCCSLPRRAWIKRGHQGESALVMAATQTQYGIEHVRIVEMLLRAGASRDAARARLKGRLSDRYYRTYPLHGRTNAEKILRLLNT